MRNRYILIGIKELNAHVDDSYWQDFTSTLNNYESEKFCLGVANMSNADLWHFAHLECYALRVYSRALTDEEVLDNYNMTVSYHDFLERGGNSVIDSN